MDYNNITQAIQNLFLSRQWTLSCAESCTGGALSAALTKMAGCSAYFLGSVVAYSNELKIKLLDVDPVTIAQEGAVSAATVIQMAEGVLNLTGSDYSVAVSGIAGPTGETPDKPVGTIWAAIASKHQSTEAWTFTLHGTRKEIIEKTTEILLKELLNKLLNL